MNQISREHLTAVSYLDIASLGDRNVNLMPFWDGEQWHMWVQGSAGLMELRVVDVMQVDYVSKVAAKDTDLFIPFVDLMWQRASWPEACSLIAAICEDFHNMGTSIAKLRHFFFFRDSLGDATSRFAVTELEYLVVLARTVFDLLQELMSRLWQTRLHLNDPVAEKRRKATALPETFSRVVLRDKTELRSAQEIGDKFGLPDNICKAYVAHAQFFRDLRAIRDDVVHGIGAGISYVFNTERGFCVDPKASPFKAFLGWQDSDRYNENLVSLLPWVAWTVLQTIFACNELMEAFASVVVFPPEIAPGYHVFVRGPCNDALIDVLRVSGGAPPWWDIPPDVRALHDAAFEERVRTRAYFLWLTRGGSGSSSAGDDWETAERIERGLRGR